MKITQTFLRGRLSLLAALSAVTVLFAACSKDLSRGEQMPVAGLMAFNLATDKPHVGVSLSGNNLVNSPLNFSSYTGGYLNIYPGNRSIRSFNGSRDSLLAASEYVFDVAKYYSVFVMGNNGVYKNVVAWDNLDSLSDKSGKAYLRYVDAIPDSGKATVSITSAGAKVLSDPASFGQVSEFVPVTPGEVQVSVQGAESGASASRTISLESGKAYTVLLVGLPTATDSTRAVQIRFIKNAG